LNENVRRSAFCVLGSTFVVRGSAFPARRSGSSFPEERFRLVQGRSAVSEAGHTGHP
jgi:hypothetical protein